MVTKKRVTLLAFIFSIIAGCSTVDPTPAFDDTQTLVSARGIQKIHWRTGGAEDAEVDALVTSLLARDLTAESAVQIALLNNRNLQATYERLRIAQADLVSAGLLRNPIFDAELRFPSAGGTGLEFALVQDFIDVLFIPLKEKVAGAALEATKKRVGGEILDLAAEVRKSFYSLQAALQNVEMRQQILASAEASFEISKRLRAAHNITELDFANERALYEQTKLDLRDAEIEVLRGREKLNELLGLWGAQTQWTAAARLPEIPKDEIPYQGLERKAVEQSLDLAALRHDIDRAGASLGLAQPTALFPEGEIGGLAEKETDGEWLGGVLLSLPVPLFNQGQPQIAAAQAAHRQLAERYMADAVTLRARVRSAHAAVIAAREQALYYKEVLLPLRQQIVTQSQLFYNAMQIGPTQLLMAKQQQIETGSSYILALRRYWVLRTELDLLLSGRMGAVMELEGQGVESRVKQASLGGH